MEDVKIIDLSNADQITAEQAINHLELAAFGCANELEMLIESLESVTQAAALIPKETILNLLAPAKMALDARERAAISLVYAQTGRMINGTNIH